MKVLLVENNDLTAKHLKDILIRGAYLVTTVKHSQDALIKLKNERYDIILTEWFMPEIDGLELTRKLRKNNITTPVIMLIPPADVKMATAFAKSMGVTDCISNQPEAKELFQSTRKCFNNSISKGS